MFKYRSPARPRSLTLNLTKKESSALFLSEESFVFKTEMEDDSEEESMGSRGEGIKWVREHFCRLEHKVKRGSWRRRRSVFMRLRSRFFVGINYLRGKLS